METQDLHFDRDVKKQEANPALLLFRKKPQEKYIEECTQKLEKLKEAKEEKNVFSIFIFRLGNEWLAITTTVLYEILINRQIHSIPHRSNEILLGVVNFRGKFALCINLLNFLGIKSEKLAAVIKKDSDYQFFLAIQKEQEPWIFPVAEVYGVVHCEMTSLEKVPATRLKFKGEYLRGVIKWNGKSVGYLDEELLFHSLERSIL